MENENKITSSVYRWIAIDIAQNIINGKYVEGQRLFGRSVLASQYKVSPETIRKAVHILDDLGVLKAEKGSGIRVVSTDKAREFAERYNQIESMTATKQEILKWAQRQAKETAGVIDKIQFIVDTAERLKNVSPLVPFELAITHDSTAIGKTVNDLQFWHNTGATIIAIKRGEMLIVSPGPYAEFCEGDRFYIVGNETTFSAAKSLLYGG